MVSQKCQYAIRATFELARRQGQGPVKIGEIAEAQSIPPRFLGGILNQLRGAGFVRSRRGAEGGYYLARHADKLSVGEIIRFIEGPQVPVACMDEKGAAGCPQQGRCVFLPMWRRASEAASNVYDRVSFQDLLREESTLNNGAFISYCI